MDINVEYGVGSVNVHTEVDEWLIDSEGRLVIYKGNRTVAAYNQGFWQWVSTVKIS